MSVFVLLIVGEIKQKEEGFKGIVRVISSDIQG